MKWILLIGLVFSQWAGSDIKKPVWKTGQSKIKIQPEYESCKEVDLSSLSLEESSSKKKTEGEFCFSCVFKKAFGFGEMQETAQTLQHKAFKEKLQKRVIGQIESKIYQTKILRACITEDRQWFARKKVKVDWPLMRAACKKKTKELKASIKERWSEMRVNLALSSPAIREDRILSNNSTWFDSSPSHLISDFTDLPKLSSREKVKARKLYVETLAETSLEKFSPSQFKHRMYKGKPLHLPFSGERYLTSNDKTRLKQAVGDLQKQAKESYFQITSEMPVLGYLKRGNPKKKELDGAFLKIEEKLEDFLKKAKKKKVNMGLLLSFRPLVEELLKEEKGYCLVAEKARIEAETNESLKNWAMMGAGVVAAVPCFITGPVGVTVCLAGGVALGAWGYKEAQVAAKESMGRALTGKEFEIMAELNEKERDEFLEKVLLPTAFWGTTAGTARAVRGWLRGGKTVAERKKLGEKSLGRALSKKEAKALERAHRVGMGEKGKDGTPARIGNYTEAQLREKARILREAGFSRAERQKLIRDGVVGDRTMEAQATIDKPQRVDRSRAADQRAENRRFWEGAEQRKAQRLYGGLKVPPELQEVQYVLYNGPPTPPLRFISVGDKASASLGKSLNENQLKAVKDAHLVGIGEKGKDGTQASLGNYTQAHLREKNRILKEAGFSQAEIRKLMEDGIVGLRLFSKKSAEDAIYKPGGNAGPRKATFKDPEEISVYLSGMSDADNIRHNRANFDHFFDQVNDSLKSFDSREEAIKRISKGRVVYGRMTKAPSDGRRIRPVDVYTESELEQQRRLLLKAGYSKQETQTILEGDDGSLIPTDEFGKLFNEVHNPNSTSTLAKDIQNSGKRDKYIKQWMKIYDVSERAATELMYQLRQSIEIQNYIRNNLTDETGALKPGEYEAWIERNTL